MQDRAKQWRLELLGARVLGPEPVRDVWVPLEEGVHALYGLNGAGKTRLLSAVADLYAGAGSGYLIARAVPVGDNCVGLSELLEDALIPKVDSEWLAGAQDAGWLGDDRPALHRLVGEHLWAAAEVAAWGADLPTLVAEIDEIVRQEIFALTPRAATDGNSPSWTITPAINITALTPVLQADIDSLSEAYRSYTRAAVGSGLDPFSKEDEGHDELKQVFSEVVREARGYGDSALTALSPVHEALWDLNQFEREIDTLGRSGVIAYRLGHNDLFEGLGVLRGRVAKVVRSDQLTLETIDVDTRRYLGCLPNSAPLSAVADGSVSASEELLARIAALSTTSAAVYETLLADAPRLYVDTRSPDEWFFTTPVDWVAIDLAGRHVPLDQLSEAQRRWALVAISLVLAAEQGEYITGKHLPIDDTGPPEREPGEWWIGHRPLIVALDEPDAALHATAQRHAVSGLLTVGRGAGGSFICSTHSREFLNADEVTLHHVTRDVTGAVVVHTLADPYRARVEELGLEPADLFLLHRAVLVVEGSHDETVLDALIGDELRRARVLVVPMRGGRLLATVIDAHVLANFSDAPVIAALDNLGSTEIQAFWDELVARRAGGQEAFDKIVRSHFSNRRRDEEIFLISYCRKAAEAGQLGRFRIFGFSRPDIQEYLPVNAIVPGANSWLSLRKEFEGQSKLKSFKSWLEARYGIKITEDVLRKAAAELDAIPQDFSDLLELCQEASRRT